MTLQPVWTYQELAGSLAVHPQCQLFEPVCLRLVSIITSLWAVCAQVLAVFMVIDTVPAWRYNLYMMQQHHTEAHTMNTAYKSWRLRLALESMIAAQAWVAHALISQDDAELRVDLQSQFDSMIDNLSGLIAECETVGTEVV
jgi:hypothetical protein